VWKSASGPDPALDPDDRPGGPDDAIQGEPPREHARLLGARAAAEYRQRLAYAMRHFPDFDDDEEMGE
jgi:hypothetical protein